MLAPGPALLLSLLLALPLNTIPVGGELPVSTPVLQPAPQGKTSTQTASNGTGFLVVWNDGALRAMRVDGDGNPLDMPAREVTPFALEDTVAVASDGRDYVVAYGCGTSVQAAICLARVDAASGAVTRGGRVTEGFGGALASNGDGYLLAYRTASGAAAVIAVRADAGVEGSPTSIAASVYPPEIATNGDNYLVIWSNYTSLGGAIVSPRATPVKLFPLTESVPSFGPAALYWDVASDGEDYLVAWQANIGVAPPQYNTALHTRPVSSEGEAGARQVVPTGGENAWGIEATWMGDDYLLTYTHVFAPATTPYIPPGAPAGDLRMVQVSREGVALFERTFLTTTPGLETQQSTASNGTVVLASWIHQMPLPNEVRHVMTAVIGDESVPPRLVSLDPA